MNLPSIIELAQVTDWPPDDDWVSSVATTWKELQGRQVAARMLGHDEDAEALEDSLALLETLTLTTLSKLGGFTLASGPPPGLVDDEGEALNALVNDEALRALASGLSRRAKPNVKLARRLIAQLPSPLWKAMVEGAWSPEVQTFFLCAPPPDSRLAHETLTTALAGADDRRRLVLLEVLAPIAAYRGLESDDDAARLVALIESKPKAAVAALAITCAVKVKPSLMKDFLSGARSQRLAALAGTNVLTDPGLVLPFLAARDAKTFELAVAAVARVGSLDEGGVAKLISVFPRVPASMRDEVMSQLARNAVEPELVSALIPLARRADPAGAFVRGWLARAHAESPFVPETVATLEVELETTKPASAWGRMLRTLVGTPAPVPQQTRRSERSRPSPVARGRRR